MRTTRQLWKLLKARINTLSDFSEEELRQLEKWDFLRDDIVEHRQRQLTQNGLSGLKEKIMDCKLCSCPSPERITGYGSQNPKVLFIVEDLTCQETINKIIGYTGLDIGIYAVVPVKKCLMGEASISDLRMCNRFLRAQIHLLRPRVLVFLGDRPLEAWTPAKLKYGVPENFHGKPVLKLFSPEALLEQPSLIQKQKSLIDLNREIL